MTPEYIELTKARLRKKMREAGERQRILSGSRSLMAKITEQTVRAVRSRAAAGESRYALAREVGLSPSAIDQIVWRKTWKHVL